MKGHFSSRRSHINGMWVLYYRVENGYVQNSHMPIERWKAEGNLAKIAYVKRTMRRKIAQYLKDKEIGVWTK